MQGLAALTRGSTIWRSSSTPSPARSLMSTTASPASKLSLASVKPPNGPRGFVSPKYNILSDRRPAQSRHRDSNTRRAARNPDERDPVERDERAIQQSGSALQ